MHLLYKLMKVHLVFKVRKSTSQMIMYFSLRQFSLYNLFSRNFTYATSNQLNKQYFKSVHNCRCFSKNILLKTTPWEKQWKKDTWNYWQINTSLLFIVYNIHTFRKQFLIFFINIPIWQQKQIAYDKYNLKNQLVSPKALLVNLHHEYLWLLSMKPYEYVNVRTIGKRWTSQLI